MEILAYNDDLGQTNEILVYKVPKEELIESLAFLKRLKGFKSLLSYFIDILDHSFVLNIILKNIETGIPLKIETIFNNEDSVSSLRNLYNEATPFEEYYSKVKKINLDFIENVKKEATWEPTLSFDLSCRYPKMIAYMNEEDIQNIYFKRDRIQNFEFYNNQDFFSYSTLENLLIEKASGITIPERAQALRMIFLELEKIKLQVEYILERLYLFSEYKKLEDLLAYYLKLSRFLDKLMMRREINVIGGISVDINQRDRSDLKNLLKRLNPILEPFLKGPIQGDDVTHFVSKDQFFSFSLFGINSRAAGLNYDLRKRAPFYFYKDVSFKVEMLSESTPKARFKLRVLEILQSIKILNQLLDNLPAGECSLGILKEKLNDGIYFQELESSRGIIGAVLEVSSGVSKLYKLGHQDVAFSFFENIVEDVHFSELESIIQSFGLHPWERIYL